MHRIITTICFILLFIGLALIVGYGFVSAVDFMMLSPDVKDSIVYPFMGGAR